MAFTRTKYQLVSPPVLAYFQPGLETRLKTELTDASRTNDLGYALMQRHGNSCSALAVSSVRQSLHHIHRISIRDGQTRVSRRRLGQAEVPHLPRWPEVHTCDGPSSSGDDVQLPQPQPDRESTVAAPCAEDTHVSIPHRLAERFSACCRRLSRAPVNTPTSDNTLGEEDPQYASPAIRACLRHTDSSQPCLSFMAVQNAAKTDP